MNARRLGRTDLVVSAVGPSAPSLGGGLCHHDDRESGYSPREPADMAKVRGINGGSSGPFNVAA